MTIYHPPCLSCAHGINAHSDMDAGQAPTTAAAGCTEAACACPGYDPTPPLTDAQVMRMIGFASASPDLYDGLERELLVSLLAARADNTRLRAALSNYLCRWHTGTPSSPISTAYPASRPCPDACSDPERANCEMALAALTPEVSALTRIHRAPEAAE